jgi:hypothetical protein
VDLDRPDDDRVRGLRSTLSSDKAFDDLDTERVPLGADE